MGRADVRVYTRIPISRRLMRLLVIDIRSNLIIDNCPCWTWTGSKYPAGYGSIAAGGKHGGNLLTHRVAYELWKGPIPAGLDIDHLCRNRACCNPAHLEAVTRRENLARGAHPRSGRPAPNPWEGWTRWPRPL